MPDELRFETEPNALRLDDLLRQDNRSTGAEFGSSLSSALEELDRISTLRYEPCDTTMQGSTHAVWLDGRRTAAEPPGPPPTTSTCPWLPLWAVGESGASSSCWRSQSMRRALRIWVA